MHSDSLVANERVSVDVRIDKLDQLLLDNVSLGPEVFDRLREAQQKLGLLGDRPPKNRIRSIQIEYFRIKCMWI